MACHNELPYIMVKMIIFWMAEAKKVTTVNIKMEA